MTSSVEDEPISTLSNPLPLPPYEFEDTLSEDENLLTWVSILARHSASKKGHMGTIFVRPPQQGDPSQSPSTQCQPPISARIAHYANNTPLLYAHIAKSVPEVHAEALAISRCARRGIPLEGCTVYISYPPCNDCFKLLLSAGIKRCVFKKSIPIANAQGEAVLVAAQVEGMKLVGTLDEVMKLKAQDDEQQAELAKAIDRKRDQERDARVRRHWEIVGEDANKTRSRVSRWWADWNKRYKDAEEIVFQGLHHVRPREKEVKNANCSADSEEQTKHGILRPSPPIQLESNSITKKRVSAEVEDTQHKAVRTRTA